MCIFRKAVGFNDKFKYEETSKNSTNLELTHKIGLIRYPCPCPNHMLHRYVQNSFLIAFLGTHKYFPQTTIVCVCTKQPCPLSLVSAKKL